MSSEKDLLDRHHETPFAEIAQSDLAALLELAAISPDVRNALTARVRLEHALYAGLEEPSVTAAELLRASRPPRATSRVWIIPALTACCLLVGLVLWWFSDRIPPGSVAMRSSATAPAVVAPKPAGVTISSSTSLKRTHSPVEATRPDVKRIEALDVAPQFKRHWLRPIPASVEKVTQVIFFLLEPPPRQIRIVSWNHRHISVDLGEWNSGRAIETLEQAISMIAPGLERRFAEHPLATEPLREGVTLSLELEAALEADAFRDAARLIPTLADLNGLVPAIGDPARIAPSGVVIAETIAEHPKLAEALETQFGSTALQSVRQAIAMNDSRTIGRIAVRFRGTQAAAEAHRWLGGRALAVGDFPEALHQFQSARAAIGELDPLKLEARINLARALAGTLNNQTPSSSPVTIGSATIPADEWNMRLADLNKARRIKTSSETPPLLKLPAPGPRQAHQRFRLTGDLGRNPTDGDFQNFDWPGRQLAVTVDRGIAYISNRFQVIAFDVNDNTSIWANRLGSEQGDAHAWPNVPFKPLIKGERIFVRRLLGRGPELVAFSANDDGTLLWRSHPELTIASEPWFDDERLWAITAPDVRRGNRPLTLSLTQFRGDDGKILATTPLIVLHPTATDPPAVQVTPLPHGFCLQTPGAVARFDYDGAPRWLRRLPFIPAEIDPHRGQVAIVPPIVVENSIYLSAPDSRDIIRLDAESGRFVWRRSIDRLSRLIVANDDVVVARADDRLLGFDSETGMLKWNERYEGLLDGALADGVTLLVARRVADESGNPRLGLSGINIETGELAGETAILRKDAAPQAAGPFFLADGNIYLFINMDRQTGESEQPGPAPPDLGERMLIDLAPPTP